MTDKGVSEIEIEDLYCVGNHVHNGHHRNKCTRLVLAAIEKLSSLEHYPLLLYLIVGFPFACVTPYILIDYGLPGALALFGTLCELELWTMWKYERPNEGFREYLRFWRSYAEQQLRLIERKW